jgi:hypothetical protein
MITSSCPKYHDLAPFPHYVPAFSIVSLKEDYEKEKENGQG